MSSNNRERWDHITSEPLKIYFDLSKKKKVYFGRIAISNYEVMSLCVLEIARLLRQILKISYLHVTILDY